MEITASNGEIPPVSSDPSAGKTPAVPEDSSPAPAGGEIPETEVLPAAPDYMGNTIDTTA